MLSLEINFLQPLGKVLAPPTNRIRALSETAQQRQAVGGLYRLSSLGWLLLNDDDRRTEWSRHSRHLTHTKNTQTPPGDSKAGLPELFDLSHTGTDQTKHSASLSMDSGFNLIIL